MRRLVAFITSRRGNVAVLTGLLMVPFVACLSLGGELGMWFYTNRSMQNAADSAAIAAATTRSTTTAVFQPEANAVATQYGYANGTNNVTVSATYGVTTGQGCSAAEPCYKVQISKTLPLYFAAIVGFPGNATLNGQKAETITATAISTSTASVGGPSVLCILALGSVSDAILLHGHPDSVMTGCDIASNDETRCTGSPIDGVNVSFALGSQNSCGSTNEPITSALPDPEAGLAADIPVAPLGQCTSYSQSLTQNTPNPFTGPNQTKFSCGNYNLTSSNTANGVQTWFANDTLVVENGQLNVAGYALNATAGATVIFTNNGATPPGTQYGPTGNGGGVFEINAPSTGTWANMAFYEDPALTSGIDMTFNGGGSNPSFVINGLLYFPKANITISGSVNQSADPTGTCMGWIVGSLLINGNGSILDDTSQCSNYGITLPPGPPGTNIALVQ